jgi:squalene synthase HpnC
MPVDHYENFPVASLLIPARLRPAVEAIYAWARCADDLADEGVVAPEQRLSALADMQSDLYRIEQGLVPEQAVAQRLAPMVTQYHLPIGLFHDLLSAFMQDVTTLRYAHFEQVRDYCRRSADPVGRLMLHLYGTVSPENLAHSDAICTGLQLANFWQDVAIDWQKNRVYLPQDSLQQFGVSEGQIAAGVVDTAWKNLMRHEVQRTRSLLESGSPLALLLPGRLGWELRLVIQGGLRILQRIEQVDYDVFRQRPTLKKTDWAVMLWRACTMPRL